MTNSYDKSYLKIALPAAFEGLFMILLASTDLIMVGTLGAFPIAAVSIFAQPRLVLLCFSRSLASSVTLLVSRKADEAGKEAARGAFLPETGRRVPVQKTPPPIEAVR